ncbi:MAG: Crp/Fnr family transcriptional regulator [Acidobacteria bacterium]|nr:Crp/Fnr family transcriptional regulator [Acidobacteriota bacterium]
MTTAWLEQLARYAAPLDFPAGVTLHPQGAPVRELYAVKSGLVKLTCLNDNGDQTILGLRATGYLSGGTAAALGDVSLAATVTATACELLRLPVPRFLNLLRNDLTFAWQWQQMQSLDNQCQQRLTIALRCFDAEQRFEHSLWHLAVTQGLGTENVKIQLPVPHQEFAELMDVTPAYLARCITRLEKKGKLRRDRGWLVVPSLDQLWRVRHWPVRDPGAADRKQGNTGDGGCFLI